MVMMIIIVMFIVVRFHFQSVYFKSSATENLLCFAQILKEHLVTIQNVHTCIMSAILKLLTKIILKIMLSVKWLMRRVINKWAK